ncbi:hypothetical protein [Falsiroseomonas sp. E2-1-a4]|uniref:hypothetical protein n=1 Tax=Falsiroseomonas sp. E2-1-a4 TaxID=3239299 RepID=UPI003F38DFE5
MQPRGAVPVSRAHPLRWLRLPTLASLLLGAACAQPDRADPVVVLQEALASHQASLAGIVPRPVAAGGEGSVAPSTPPAPLPSRNAAAGAPPAMAGQLVGHPPGAVLAWLGEPRLRREEGHAEIWHYQGPQCHLDLFFYRDDAPGAGLLVAFAAARAIGTARRGEAACLQDIARGATAPSVPASAPEEAPEPVRGA